MSNQDSSFSKEQQNLLKAFKKQISHPESSKIKAQAEKPKAQIEQDPEDDLAIFMAYYATSYLPTGAPHGNAKRRPSRSAGAGYQRAG